MGGRSLASVTIDGLTLRLVARATDGRILDDFTIAEASALRAADVTASAARMARMRAPLVQARSSGDARAGDSGP